MTMVYLGNIADFVDDNDPQKRTYRQINTEKEHSISIGSLVEIDTGVRLFVALQGRDCDMTPLYWLTPREDDFEAKEKGFANMKWIGGYPEDSLIVIKENTNEPGQ